MGKLREIAKTVQSTEHLIECTPIKQNYREISTKLTTLLNIYEAFYPAKTKSEEKTSETQSYLDVTITQKEYIKYTACF